MADIKIEFAPGCFDDFEGTQDELDQLVAEITAMAQSGELFEQTKEFGDEDFDLLPDEAADRILAALVEDEAEIQQLFSHAGKRTLH